MRLSVYVATAMEDKDLAREIHAHLARLDFVATSRWAESELTSNDFNTIAPTEIREQLRKNDADVRASDAVLVVARAGVGGEMFCEARFALELQKPVLWLGRRILSSFRPGVILVDNLESALSVLEDMRAKHAEGYRGHLLAVLCGAAA